MLRSSQTFVNARIKKYKWTLPPHATIRLSGQPNITNQFPPSNIPCAPLEMIRANKNVNNECWQTLFFTLCLSRTTWQAQCQSALGCHKYAQHWLAVAHAVGSLSTQQLPSNNPPSTPVLAPCLQHIPSLTTTGFQAQTAALSTAYALQ